MDTLVFCTSWADSDDAWRLRCGRWLDAVLGSPLERSQILIVDDGSPCPPPFDGVECHDAERLPGSRPAAAVVCARFADRLGRRDICDYPGWWRSYAFAASYAARYGFEKVVHVESDTFLLSQRLHDHVNALDGGWIVFWCPRWRFPETCIQVIGRDQLDAYRNVTAQPYARLVGHPVERLLPFTLVESNFKGDRYGEYRTEIPLDADYASQVPAHVTVWQGRAPSPRRVLALAHDARPVPPHPNLYPADAWRHLAPVAGDENGLREALARQPHGSLDAVQLALTASSPRLPIDGRELRGRLTPAGEVSIQCRDRATTQQAALDLAGVLRAAGFAMAGVQPTIAGFRVLAFAGAPWPPQVVKERLGSRLQL